MLVVCLAELEQMHESKRRPEQEYCLIETLRHSQRVTETQGFQLTFVNEVVISSRPEFLSHNAHHKRQRRVGRIFGRWRERQDRRLRFSRQQMRRKVWYDRSAVQLGCLQIVP